MWRQGCVHVLPGPEPLTLRLQLCHVVHVQEVVWRVGNSLIGAFRANFMQVTQEQPDL